MSYVPKGMKVIEWVTMAYNPAAWKRFLTPYTSNMLCYVFFFHVIVFFNLQQLSPKVYS